MAFEHRLDRGLLVRAGLDPHQRIEREVLVLQRVHQLVREHKAQRGRVGSDDAVQRRRLRIVESRHLLGIEIEEQPLQVERIGDEAEEAIHRLDPFLPCRREVLLQLAQEENSHLLPGLERRVRRALESQPGRTLDHRTEAVHQAGKIGAFAAHRRRPPAAGEEGEPGGEEAEHHATPR